MGKEKKHALLSPSSSERWLHCPPSVRLTEDMEDEESEFAKEGTDAHELCENKLLNELGLPNELSTVRTKLKYYNEDMEKYTEDYKNYVMSEFNALKEKCPDAKIFVEEHVNFSNYIPEGEGTADCIIIADGTLEIIDFKYGLGVIVDAKDNSQFKIYSLGALNLYDNLYDIDTVKMVAFQPRRENISTFEISKDELLRWGNEELKPKAIEAFNGEGEFQASEWCRFCKARATCKHRMEYLVKHDFTKNPATICEEEFLEILSKADLITDYITDIKEYALLEALKGKKWPGYKLVESRTQRRYSDPVKVAEIVTNEGLDPYEKKLLGLTEMSKLLGKTKFEKLLGGLLEKKPGNPVLVKNEDKRDEISLASLDFKNEKGDK